MTPFVIHQSLLLDFVEKELYLTVLFVTYVFTKCKLTKKEEVQNVLAYPLRICTNFLLQRSPRNSDISVNFKHMNACLCISPILVYLRNLYLFQVHVMCKNNYIILCSTCVFKTKVKYYIGLLPIMSPLCIFESFVDTVSSIYT